MNLIDSKARAAWAVASAKTIQGAIDAVLDEIGFCNVLLTGGRSAKILYSKWRELSNFSSLSEVDFYFGDERCVPVEDENSNFGMTMRTLFAAGIPNNCSVYRMEADSENLERSVREYEKILPKNIHIAIFGLGEDGHIASIFPNSVAIHETRRRVMTVLSPKQPTIRMTITALVLKQIGRTFILAADPARLKSVTHADSDSDNVDSLPVRLAFNATWLIGN